MDNNIELSISLLGLFIVGILISWIRYRDIEIKYVWKHITKQSLFPTIYVFTIFIFVISFAVAYRNSPHNLPKLSNVSSEYTDLIDVGDGIIVVGRTRSSIADPDQPHHMYDNTRAYIVKYDYDGTLLWDDVYYIETKVDQSSSFDNVYLNDIGEIVASGVFGGYYDGYSIGEVRYTIDGKFVGCICQLKFEPKRALKMSHLITI